MAWFNRILVILILVALIPIVTIGLIVPREALEVVNDNLGQLEDQLDPDVPAIWLLVRVILALIIDSLLVVLIYLQVRRSPAFGVPVRQIEGGEARIAIDSIVEQLEYHVDPLPGVLAVRPSVNARGRGLDVELEIEMAADVNLPSNIEQISAVARRVVEEDLGLKLRGKPKLKLRTVPAPQPLTAPGPTAPAYDIVETAEEETRAEPAAEEEAPAKPPEEEAPPPEIATEAEEPTSSDSNE